MTDPVKVELHVEWPGGSADDIAEFTREEWTAMTPAQRAQACSDEAIELASNSNITFGYEITGDDAGSDQET